MRLRMNVTSFYASDVMLRQISDSGMMNKVPEGSLVDSKNKWNYVQILHVVFAVPPRWDIS